MNTTGVMSHTGHEEVWSVGRLSVEKGLLLDLGVSLRLVICCCCRDGFTDPASCGSGVGVVV